MPTRNYFSIRIANLAAEHVFLIITAAEPRLLIVQRDKGAQDLSIFIMNNRECQIS